MANELSSMVMLSKTNNPYRWVELPCPADDSYEFDIETLVDSGRNANGDMVGKVIGGDKYKVNLKWREMSYQQFRDLLRLFDSSRGGAFINYVRFFDPIVGGMSVRRMYVGNRGGRPMIMREVTPTNWEPDHILDVQANLIEV